MYHEQRGKHRFSWLPYPPANVRRPGRSGPGLPTIKPPSRYQPHGTFRFSCHSSVS
ncbi:hypothetical protein BD779DRAFT_812409 [Infundibulicybe gibba]|nr:hypothetical protein BD779DRAFT_812409 [Infundibulicybe gibba]